ncbi:MAG TPA: MBL fold metallo-hydrolase [Thermomicrobiales bacterium]|nr:MBL fold metallo-hydrolase [Thermomicrobiales bacterium]
MAIVQQWFDVRELEDGVFLIVEPFHDEQVKSHLIVGADRAILLDTGMGVGNIREVAEGLTVKPISVVNSHAHWDHIGGNHLFEEIAIHPAEADELLAGAPNATLRPWFQADSLSGPLPDGVTAETISIPPSRATSLLNYSDVIDLGGVRLQVMHCPGHSAGGIVLFDRVRGILFSTDVAYAGALYVYSVPDLAIYQHSLARLAAIAPGLRVCYPCHNATPMSPEILPKMADGLEAIVDGKAPDLVRGQVSAWRFDGFSVELKLGRDEE